nr:hypothetical protein [Escherichia coli]
MRKTARHDGRTGAGNVRYRAQTGQGAGLRLSPSFCTRYATAA